MNPKVIGIPRLADKHFVSYDNDQFGYRKWLPQSGKEPSLVIIGVHGISGHSGDYANLAAHLQKHHPDIAVYAAETRGQGMDAKPFRRGDISHRSSWYKDLTTFTRLVQGKHPKSKVIWYGESMGSLIVMHAYDQTLPADKVPEAIIISSPIVDVESKLPPWKMLAVRISAFLLPKLRVSLETLSDGQRAVVTKDDIHEEQAKKNPWYIRRYTLRLLIKLGDMARAMDARAAAIRCPVLVLHGGKDIFTEPDSVTAFYKHFPETANGMAKTRHYYPDSFHLLMYDHDRDKIFKDVSSWLDRFMGNEVTNKNNQ
ncbi:MAG: lysophospholipase [Verrucomicrobiae bacterium]|nr:lysophospholipase [Verrucomicrobiae bacterium]NNJ86209.1 alpha/beta fold hydrolase [Akkermansiaceae bacterium]